MPVAMVLIVACSRAGPPPAAPEAVDTAAALVGALPVGAHRCVAARPGAVAAQHRPLLRRLSAGGTFGWTRTGPWRALAHAERRRTLRDRRSEIGREGASVTLLAPSVPAEEAITWLEHEAPVRVRRGPVCQSEDDREACAQYRVQVLRDGVLRVTRGFWPRDVLAGVEGQCRVVVARHGDAYEVSVTRRPSVPIPALPLPTNREPDDAVGIVEVVLSPWRDGVARGRRERLPEAVPRELVELVGTSGLGVEGGDAATDIRTTLEGRDLVVHATYVWEDLRLAEDDERRLREAHAAELRRDEPVPLEEVRVEHLATVRAQVELRLARLRAALAPDATQVAELRTLLEAGFAAHPHELWLAERLVELLLGPGADPAAAAELATHVVAQGMADPVEWGRRRRGALAFVDEGALAEALEADGVLPRRQAAVAARDLVRAAGVRPYNELERMWLTIDRLARRALPTRPTGRVALRVDGLGEALLGASQTAARIRDEERCRVLVWASVSQRETDRAAAQTYPLRFDGIARGAVVAGVVDANEPAAIRMLTQRVVRAVRDGQRVELSFARMAPEAEDVLLRLSGRRDGDRVLLDRATPLSVSWNRISRYLADPLGALPVRLFPAPELVVRAEDANTADRLLGYLDASFLCGAPQDGEVRCDAHDRALARDTLVQFLREHF